MIKASVKKAKAGFFDRAAVIKAVDKATLKVLSKAGAFVRRDAKSSIKNARQKSAGELNEEEKATHKRRVKAWKKDSTKPKPKRPLASSKPGEPPRSVTGLLKKFLFFVYDAKKKTVVIGPAKLNSSSGAPSILEKGGTATITRSRFVTRGGKKKLERTTRRVAIKKRPYMNPALKKNKKKIAELYRDSIKAK